MQSGSRKCSELVAQRHRVLTLREEEIICHRKIDKVFSSVWVNNNLCFFGTKDSKLGMLDANSKKIFFHQLPPSRIPFNGLSSGIRALGKNAGGDLIACTGENSQDLVVFEAIGQRPVALLEGMQDWVFGCAWIGDRTVAGCGRDGTVRVWKIKEKYLQLNKEYNNNTLWEDIVIQPDATQRRAHSSKVRSISYGTRKQELITVGTDATVKLWDCNGSNGQTYLRNNLNFNTQSTFKQSQLNSGNSGIQLSQTIQLPNNLQDFTALVECEDSGCYCIGSYSHALLVDFRIKGQKEQKNRIFNSIDDDEGESRNCVVGSIFIDGLGIRSAVSSGPQLILGLGDGRLIVVDERMRKIIRVPEGTNKDQMGVRQGERVNQFNSQIEQEDETLTMANDENKEDQDGQQDQIKDSNKYSFFIGNGWQYDQLQDDPWEFGGHYHIGGSCNSKFGWNLKYEQQQQRRVSGIIIERDILEKVRENQKFKLKQQQKMDGSIQSWKRWFQQMKYRDEQVYKYSDDEYEDDDEDYEEEEDEDEEDDLKQYRLNIQESNSSDSNCINDCESDDDNDHIVIQAVKRKRNQNKIKKNKNKKQKQPLYKKRRMNEEQQVNDSTSQPQIFDVSFRNAREEYNNIILQRNSEQITDDIQREELRDENVQMIISNDSLGPSYSAIDFLNTIMLNNDSTYAQIPNSVYTLSLNSAGRLFAGGGPFLVSAKGCYIGLW